MYQGTWKTRAGHTVKIISTAPPYYAEQEIPAGHWDINGNYINPLNDRNPDYDLAERISEKDLRK